MRVSAFACAAALGLLTAGPAQGQAWIGQIAGEVVAQQRETACMRGQLPPASEQRMALVRAGANGTMARYFALAAASESSDVSGVFSRRRTRTWERLSAGEVLSDVGAINDPFARAAGAAIGEAEAIVLAGDGASAAGAWVVRDAQGNPLGHYRGVFRRERREWVLWHLNVGEGPPEPVTPYCHVVGDVVAAPAPQTEPAAAPATDPAAPTL